MSVKLIIFIILGVKDCDLQIGDEKRDVEKSLEIY